MTIKLQPHSFEVTSTFYYICTICKLVIKTKHIYGFYAQAYRDVNGWHDTKGDKIPTCSEVRMEEALS